MQFAAHCEVGSGKMALHQSNMHSETGALMLFSSDLRFMHFDYSYHIPLHSSLSNTSRQRK